MDKSKLKKKYIEVLKAVTEDVFMIGEDKYSGVFLPFHFEEFENAPHRIMVIGRETAGWNSKNKKNTLSHIIQHNKNNSLEKVIDEAESRYSWHLKDSPNGVLKTKHTSHFQRYYCKIAEELGLKPEAMIYGNLFAWDYNGVSPLTRPESERSKITDISVALLTEQIKFFKPEFIIFATGCTKIDSIIKRLFNESFEGYTTTSVDPKKLWEFKAANALCFRVAHPRALSQVHIKSRMAVINRIKESVSVSS
jgi:hypothetical protein